MAAPVWTLEIDGTTKTLAAWGLIAPRLTTVNLGRDTLIADAARDFTGTPIATYGQAVKLYRDAVQWFAGETHITPRSARGPSERLGYTFIGPWNFLERNIYKAPWFQASDGSTVYTSHVLFLIKSVAAHITDLLTYAIARGADIQIGTITAPITPPSFEVTDLTIAGAIQRLAHYAPDCVGWFDYTTDPPTFHFQPRSALTGVTLEMPSANEPFGSRLEVIEPISRDDMQVDNVSITYEINSTVDGEEVFGFSIDNYPVGTTGLEDGCLSAVVNLQGFSATTVNGFVIAEAINTASLDWWKLAVPALNDARILGLAFVGSAERLDYETGAAAAGLPRRLIDGQVAEWMVNPDGTDIDWQKEVITCEFSMQLQLDDAAELSDLNVAVTKQKYQVELTSTNAPAGETSYSTLATFEDGDELPVGMAQYLYNSLNPLQYEALLVQHKADCDGEVRLGNVVNLTGGLAAWASMNALVQQVACDIDLGVTEITCGPPRHLSIDQILELLRVGRIRRRWTNPSTQTDGTISARNVELGKATANNNAVPATPELSRLVIASTGAVIDLNTASSAEKLLLNFGSGKTVTVAKDDTLWGNPDEASRALALREVCVKVSGVSRKMLVLGSVPYD